MSLNDILQKLGVSLDEYAGKGLSIHSPIDGSLLAGIKTDSKSTVDKKIARVEEAFKIWCEVPAPRRGELIRLFGDELRKVKEPLGELVTMECGKILEEGKGEVQEMIDICDYAVGLSRTIGGLTIPSERPEHNMEENWLPLGPVGLISAFNFPVAVWAWNFTLAVICGDSVIWKPSEKTPITAIACQAIFKKALKKFGKDAPEGLSEIIIGDAKTGDQMVNDHRIKLISATGSCRMGKEVAPVVARRMGRVLLELGGNNAAIVTPSADLDITLPSIIFGAVGTAGQRCTSTRRVFAHKDIYENLFNRIKTAYGSLTVKIGDPLDSKTLIGPLLDKDSYKNMQASLKKAEKDALEIIGGKRVLEKQYPNAYYVEPALVKLDTQTDIVKHETFAPILYVMPYDTLDEALAMHNDVAQGLSSTIFTNDLKEAAIFKKYSDCGIANVNIGTSGAEIGGAFGGEKETGGGRESGSDSWRAYMRRQTSTTYYGSKPPALAQGIKFE